MLTNIIRTKDNAGPQRTETQHEAKLARVYAALEQLDDGVDRDWCGQQSNGR